MLLLACVVVVAWVLQCTFVCVPIALPEAIALPLAIAPPDIELPEDIVLVDTPPDAMVLDPIAPPDIDVLAVALGQPVSALEAVWPVPLIAFEDDMELLEDIALPDAMALAA